MCLAIPVRITEVMDDSRALAAAGNVVREINTMLVEDVKVGEYVILHVGFALSKVNPEEAEKTLEMMRQGLAMSAGESP